MTGKNGKRKIEDSDNPNPNPKQKPKKSKRDSLNGRAANKDLLKTRSQIKQMADVTETLTDQDGQAEMDSDQELQDSVQDSVHARQQTRLQGQIEDLKIFLEHKCQTGSNVLTLYEFRTAGENEKEASIWIDTTPYETIPILNSMVAFKSNEDPKSLVESKNKLITLYLNGKFQQLYNSARDEKYKKELDSGIKDLREKQEELTKETGTLRTEVQSLNSLQKADRKDIDEIKIKNLELHGMIMNLIQEKNGVNNGGISPRPQPHNTTVNIQEIPPNGPTLPIIPTTTQNTTRHSNAAIKAAMEKSKGNKHEAAFELLYPAKHEEVVKSKSTTLPYFRFCEMRRDKKWGPKFENTIQQINRWLKTEAKVEFFMENKDCCFNIRLRDDDRSKNVINPNSTPAEREDLVKEIQGILDEAQIELEDDIKLTSDHIDWNKTGDASKSNMKMFVNSTEWDEEKENGMWFRCYHIFMNPELREAGIIPKIQAAESRRRNQQGVPKYPQRISLLKDPMLGTRCLNCGSNTHWSHDCEAPTNYDRSRPNRGRNNHRSFGNGYGRQRRFFSSRRPSEASQ